MLARMRCGKQSSGKIGFVIGRLAAVRFVRGRPSSSEASQTVVVVVQESVQTSETFFRYIFSAVAFVANWLPNRESSVPRAPPEWLLESQLPIHIPLPTIPPRPSERDLIQRRSCSALRQAATQGGPSETASLEQAMARLEYIRHEFFDASLSDKEELVWIKQSKKPIDRLPQIFWNDGSSWREANLWALDKVASNQVSAETTKRTMKHLYHYANFLESREIDWRHFPVRKDEQVLRKFRRHLIEERDDGILASTTASNCMSTVIQFYRFADAHNLVDSDAPMWIDHLAVIPFHDAAGFKRTMVRLSCDLSIPNRKRVGNPLEDGLLPLRSEHMSKLLAYTAKHETSELHLMLSAGFFTGARIGTITTLTVSSVHTAREDPHTPSVFRLPVGPGTGVATKFSVAGELMVPKAVLVDLKAYASSTTRLLREAKAQPEHKNLLFLSRRAQPYTVGTVDRLVNELRKRAVAAGMQFMAHFKFHQSRATFGTWLMQLLLESDANTTDAIGIVRDAMLHKDERATLGYIKFLESIRAKKQAAAEFNEAFTGLRNRNWDNADA